MYYLYRTNRFNKEVEKLSKEDVKRIDKIIEQLKSNPYVGDQLQIKVLREKRLNGKRIYYLIFEDLESVLMIATSDKKAQQKVIDFIIDNVNNYRGYLKKLMNN